MKKRVQWQLVLLLLLALGAAWVTFSASRVLLRSTSPEVIRQTEKIRAMKPVLESEAKKLDELKLEDRKHAQWTVIGLAFYLLLVMVLLERLSEKWAPREDEMGPLMTEQNDASPEFKELPHMSPEILAQSPLTLLIEDLQDAAHIDSQLHISSHRASEILRHAVERTQPLIRARRVQLQSRVLSGGEIVNSIPDFWFECDFHRTARAIQYLIESAVKNAKPNELIALLVEKTEKDVLFLVADDGDGMEQERLESLITSPIWEAQSLRISMASAMARKLGAQLWGESKVGKGTKLYLRLPLNAGTAGFALKTELESGAATAAAGTTDHSSVPQS